MTRAHLRFPLRIAARASAFDRITSLAASLACVTAVLAASPAAADLLVRLDDYRLGELDGVAFELPRAAKLEIEAVGVRLKWSPDDIASAWLLDTRTRDVVWIQDAGDGERVDDDRMVRRTRDTVDVPAGRYELWAWAGESYGDGPFAFRFADWAELRSLAGKHATSDRELRRAVRKCYVEVRAPEMPTTEVRKTEPAGDWPEALVRHAMLGEEAFVRTTFRLDRDMELRVYALGEQPRGFEGAADGSWIVDATTRERVWSFDRRRSHAAGGASKNRLDDDTIRLNAGRYELYAGTDDSHSWDDWNAAPPHDPTSWGVTLLPGKDFDRAAFHVEEEPARAAPLLALTRVGNDEVLERPFRLARAAKLQIYALGEYDDRNDEFADRAWISKAGKGEVVWEMRERDAFHAGGAEKNRLFDGTVELPAGDYVAHFDTDDSHAFGDWNASPPFDREAWGLALYAGAGMKAGDFRAVESRDEKRTQSALVELVEVGDDAHRRATFTLEKRTVVHIYALGEAQDGVLYDTAWIVDTRTDKTVWEMTWRNTDHAGGAKKNRVFDGDVTLDAGTYEVHYETDSSHSYPDWNAARPRDPRRWGITIGRAGGE